MTCRPTPTRRRLLVTAPLVVVLTLAAAACGGGDDADGATTSVAASTGAPAPATTTASTTTVVATSDTADLSVLPVGTGDLPPIGTGDLPPIGTGDLPLPPVTADLPYQLSVTVGLDSSPERIERVPLGATIALAVTNPTAADEFHLHGFDLGDGVEMPAGQTETFTFVADQAGSFELESHATGEVLMILEVV
ncbi:MAG: hypothetical protein U0Q03_10730 [Acidimicrobiales bacterium]